MLLYYLVSGYISVKPDISSKSVSCVFNYNVSYILCVTGQRTEGIEMLLQPTVISQLQQTAEKNDVVQCRVFEVWSTSVLII